MRPEAEDNIRREIAFRLSSSEFLINALRQAAQSALAEHKQSGDPVAGWRDDHVVWIPASEINVPQAQ